MCTNLQSIKSKAKDAKPGQRQGVRCGKCDECLKENQREWIYRLESEQDTSEHSLFLTLTYNPANVPFIEKDTREIFPYSYAIKYKPHTECDLCINPKDAQDYWKRVRDRLNYPELKHYTCMEYGDEFGRPHLHSAVFYNGVDPVQMEGVLEECWQDKGFIRIGPLVEERIAYVTKYLKKGESEAAPSDLSLPPRSLKSHGLGVKKFFVDERQYQEYYKQCLAYADRTGDYSCVPKSEQLKMVRTRDGCKLSLPRYYRRKYYPHEDFLTEQIIEDENRRFNKLRAQILGKMQDLRCKGYECDFEKASYAVLSDRDSDRIKQDLSDARKRRKGL